LDEMKHLDEMKTNHRNGFSSTWIRMGRSSQMVVVGDSSEFSGNKEDE
jgi:hypothetical protein